MCSVLALFVYPYYHYSDSLVVHTLADNEFFPSDCSLSVTSDDGSDSDGPYLVSLMQHHKGAFYNAYTPIWDHLKKYLFN
jgi:hypothetical protein